MRIVHKLGFGVLGMALLIGVVGHFGFRAHEEVRESAHAIDTAHCAYEGIAKLEIIISDKVHEGMHLLAFGDEDCIKKSKDLGNKFRQQLAAIHSEKTKVKSEAILSKHEKFEKAFDLVVGAHKAGQITTIEQRRNMHDMWCSTSDEIIELTRRLQQGYVQVIQDAHKKMRRVITMTDRKIILATIVAGLLVIGIALFVGRYINNPVMKLSDAALEIANGNLNVHVDIKSEDEIGQLARSFNRMAQDLRRYRSHLEMLVEKRTAELSTANGQLRAEITHRKQAEAALRSQLELEQLVATVSTSFINLAPDEIEEGINRALQMIGEFADVDRSYVFLFYDNLTKMDNTHEWCAEGIRPEIQNNQGLLIKDFPWCEERIKKLETIRIPRVADLPPGAIEKEVFESQQIQSLVLVPMIYSGSLIGFIGFDSVRVEKTWPEESITLLKLTAESFANALQRKWAEEELRRYSATLEHKNQELDQFACVVSHDLQSPLCLVEDCIQQLAKRYSHQLDADADMLINCVADRAKEMRHLIKDLLEYSRVGSEDKALQPVDCEKVVKWILVNFAERFEKSGALVTHDPLPTVMAHDEQLNRLFQNLIGNAIKFRGKEPPRVHISARPQGEEWVFSVTDNGIGVEPEEADRIFRLFYRLKKGIGYPGTGVGLAICKKIVEDYGGRMWVKSEPGKGSTFYFSIQAAD